ncbi:MAG: ABC transporter ATP-binding protein [archaeon]
MGEEKKDNPIAILYKNEWKNLGNLKKRYIIYMIFFFVAAGVSLITPLVIGMIFNTIQEQITTIAELHKLLWMISLLLVLTVLFWIFHGSGRIMQELTAFNVHRNFTNRKMRKILELPTKWHKNNHSGSTIDKLNRSRGALADFSSNLTYDILYGVMNIVGSLIILFFIDWKIALFSSVFSFVVIFSVFKMDDRLIKKYKQINVFSNKLSSSIFDYLSNIITVITLRLRKRVEKEIDDKIIASYQTEKESIILNEIKWAFSSIAISVMTVVALGYNAYTSFYSSGTILIGTLYILYGYLGKVGQSFQRFASLYGSVTRKSSRVEGISSIDEAYEKLGGENNGKLPSDWKEINITNLNFSYHDKEVSTHLENVNLNLKRGQKIALIGESGSGKSTILALLRGLYPVESGAIKVDGKEIHKGFNRMKNVITLIPQDPELFNNSIEYNITLGIQTRQDEIMKVIKMAQFESVLKRLPKGLKTNVLEKGVSLSGGEKQRLALARGLLAAKKSDIVLLDEPTSSVDSINEIKIHENVFKKYKDKTIISSIHRLHLLEKFDYIYMFEKGLIIASGNLEEMKKFPKFLKILRKQLRRD